LKNVIIGADQNEGVHCLGSCTLESEYRMTLHILKDKLTHVQTSGGPLSARTLSASKVPEPPSSRAAELVAPLTSKTTHTRLSITPSNNGASSVTIDGFTVQDFGKLYRSCGNCKGNGSKRTVTIKNVKASGGKVLAGINSNYGDVATITGSCATSVKKICVEYQGNNSGKEPKELSSGPSNACKYTTLASC
jgi:hypothetical protein